MNPYCNGKDTLSLRAMEGKFLKDGTLIVTLVVHCYRCNKDVAQYTINLLKISE